ncbi:uncharacterized protein LOC144164125 [Haemaphysalis longicornis]
MLPQKNFNRLLIGALAAVALRVAVCTAQDCQANPDDCDAAKLLADYDLINVRVSSSPSPEKLCEQYVKTSLSGDGKTAEYNYTYRYPGADDSPIYDNVTITASSNTELQGYFGSDPATIITLQLLFINAAFCYVGQANTNGTPYYLFDNPDAPLEEYFKCLDKIREYSNDNITFVRNQPLCVKIPEKP